MTNNPMIYHPKAWQGRQGSNLRPAVLETYGRNRQIWLKSAVRASLRHFHLAFLHTDRRFSERINGYTQRAGTICPSPTRNRRENGGVW